MPRKARIPIMAIILLISGACSAQPAPLPTLVPTSTTAPSPTATLTMAATESNVVPATATPFVPAESAADPNDQAFLRIVHAAAGMDAVDVYVEALNVVSSLRYGQATEQSGITAGQYQVHLTPAEMRPEESTILSMPVTIEGQDSVILVINQVAGQPALQAVTQDLAPLHSNESRLTFINTVDMATGVAVQTRGEMLTPTLTSGDTSAPVTVESGTTSFSIEVNNTSVYEFTEELRERQSYIYVLLGEQLERESLKLLSFRNPVPGLTTVRALHAGQDLGALDLYVDNTLLSSSIGFGNDTNRQTFVSGSVDVSVYPAGAKTSDDPLAISQIEFTPGDQLTLIITGDRTPRIILYREDTSPTPPDTARLILLNAQPEFSRVEFNSSDGQSASVFYGQPSETLLFDSGTYNFSWSVDNRTDDDQSLEFVDDVVLTAGTSVLYLFADLQGDVPLFYVDSVGESSPETSIAENEESNEQDTSATPSSRIRVVNSVSNSTLDFRLDDAPFVPGLTYSSGSSLINLTLEEHVLTAHDPGTGRALARATLNLTPGDFTAFVYGDPDIGYDFLVISDTGLSQVRQQPSMRFINLSRDETLFVLGIGARGTGSAINVNPDSAESDDTRIERPSVPAGIQRIGNPIESITAGNAFPAPTAAGPRDIIIIDHAMSAMASVISDVNIQIDTHYDVVAFELPNSEEVLTFLLPYPKN